MKTHEQYRDEERAVSWKRRREQERPTIAKLGEPMTEQERTDYLGTYKKIRVATQLMGEIAINSPRHTRRNGLTNANGVSAYAWGYNRVELQMDDEESVCIGGRDTDSYLVSKGEKVTSVYRPQLDGVLITRSDKDTEEVMSETLMQSYAFADAVTSKIVNTLHAVALQTLAEDRVFQDEQVAAHVGKLQ